MLSAAANAAAGYTAAASSNEPRTTAPSSTSLLVSPQGALHAVYRKAHLFGDRSKEAQLLQPGTPSLPASLGAFSAGLATRYDLRFPEQFRWPLDNGADLFIITSACQRTAENTGACCVRPVPWRTRPG